MIALSDLGFWARYSFDNRESVSGKDLEIASHMATGDDIVEAFKKVTGKKAQQIVYRHHTMYPGGLKEIKYKDMMVKKPDEVRCTPAGRLEASMSRRSSVKRSQACFRRTLCETAG